ncbi:MAG: hypothetical protein ACOYMG_29865 [Candidatus Methylumidiphilus sp.]
MNLDGAAGIGAAGFIHGLLRSTDVLQLATQSMLVGTNWSITGIQVARDGRFAPFLTPQGQVFNLYAHHHGDRILQLDHSELPFYLKSVPDNKTERVAYVDAIVTADDKNIYFHAINRSLDQTHCVRLDLEPTGASFKQAIWLQLSGRPEARVKDRPILEETSCALPVTDNVLAADLPPHSTSVFILPKASGMSMVIPSLTLPLPGARASGAASGSSSSMASTTALQVENVGGQTVITWNGNQVFSGPTSGHVSTRNHSQKGEVFAAAFDEGKVIWENVPGAALHLP